MHVLSAKINILASSKFTIFIVYVLEKIIIVKSQQDENLRTSNEYKGLKIPGREYINKNYYIIQDDYMR